MVLNLRGLTRWSEAPAKDVATATTSKINLLRGLAARATTPLLPDDYLKLLNPLWSARELRGEIVDVRRETEDSATVIIKPGWGFSADYRPGQYVGIGLRIGGRWHWRSYSLTSVPERDNKLISITVKATPEGFLSTHLVNGVESGTIVRLAAPKGDFALPDPPPAKLLLVTAGSGITPVMAMLRSMAQRGHTPDVVHVHSAPSASGRDLSRRAAATPREPGPLPAAPAADRRDGTPRLRYASTTSFRTGRSARPGRAGRRRCSTRSSRSGPMRACPRTSCTWNASSSPAPTRAVRAAPSPSPCRTRRSKSTAPPRCWKPARRWGSRCRSAVAWASAKPACCHWNPATCATFVREPSTAKVTEFRPASRRRPGDCTINV